MSDNSVTEVFSSPDVQISPDLGYAAFDADSHYYEAEDALTRHLPREWRRCGLKWAQIDGRKRLMLGDKVFNYIPNPTFDPIAKPGCMHDYFAAKLEGVDMKSAMGELEPIRPEYRDRDVRLKVMDQQGVGAVTPMRKVVTSQRAVPDFFGAMICHKVFERFPRLRMASVENGASWVKPLMIRLFRGHAQTRGYYQKNPVDQFHEHIWVTPFWEDQLDDLATFIPVERLIFGSDWPHVEGVVRPLDFLETVANFSQADKRKIMRDNTAGLTATANS